MLQVMYAYFEIFKIIEDKEVDNLEFNQNQMFLTYELHDNLLLK